MKELISAIKSLDNAHALALAPFIPCDLEIIIDLLISAPEDNRRAAESILAQLAAEHPDSDNKAAFALFRSIIRSIS